MKFHLKTLIITLAASAMLGACAKETDESDESVQQRIVEAYVEKYYPEATASESGLYIVDSTPGTGRTPQDTSYVLVEYTITHLDGSYDSYTYDSVAMQLGTYSYTAYYHPRIWDLENNYDGIVEIMTGMREGGRVKAVIPGSLLGESTARIYDVRLLEVIDNAYAYQAEQLEAFSEESFSGLDSTEYGFYFRKLNTTADSITGGHKADLRYVGKFLDGRVFDTNVEDTARKYRIYSKDNDYDVITFQFFVDEDETVETNDFVQGFSKALWRMKYGEHALTFFYSPLGYGDEGSDNIPGFVPLFFELWIEENETE
ncbi:MAG TPA: FKBP-type peptidyl-prolyl cis-trans isomerase [Candidatus Coprenecus stercoravium]|uniref:Peptidyl-prolyl cis-trans isomerase n=1 Tax=Candidatus Coprenecus stercoravium TaxID=2840735 RepID=A0A9D2K9C4_9BACT|nr:FKBP-type peptidyl-prolyl cis-trans isomerase [Candidatus Coprenecus stercoravium]